MNSKEEKAKKMLRKTAKKFSQDYNRPPNRDGDFVKRGRVYISNQSFANLGTNMHSGNWVVIKFVNSRIVVLYKTNGVSGYPDKRKIFPLEDADQDKLETKVREFL